MAAASGGASVDRIGEVPFTLVCVLSPRKHQHSLSWESLVCEEVLFLLRLDHYSLLPRKMRFGIPLSLK